MSFLLRFLHPLGRAVRVFFRHDVALRRGAGGVELVLQEREAPTTPDAGPKARKKSESRADASARKDRELLALIRNELAAVLDEVPETRQAMRHLAFVEQSLARRSLRALDKVPLDVLQKALEQFEGLVTNWSPVGLATLRSKMAVAIIDREHQTPEEAEEDMYRTAAVLDAAALERAPEPVPAPASGDGLADDAALAAAYAALGTAAPAGALEMHGELGSPSARQAARPPQRPGQEALPRISLRELQD